MNRNVLSCWVVTALFLVPAVTRAQEKEMVDNPGYLSWTKHKPGTKVDTEMTMNAAGQNMNMKIGRELIAIEKDHVVIETTTKMDIPGVPAQENKQKSNIPAKVAKGQENMPEGATGTVKMAGNESIEVAGKKYDCQIVEYTGTSQGMKSTGKIWNSVEMPGTMVKMDMNTDTGAGPSTMAMKVIAVTTK